MARQQLSGSIGSVPGTPALPRGLKNRVYVVVRGRDGSNLRGVHCGSWQALRGRIEVDGHLPPEVVFRGFPSLLEAEEYWRAATGEDEVPRITSPTG